MANLTIQVPDAAVDRILTAFTAGMQPAPATQADKIKVTRQAIADFIRNTVVGYETAQAAANKQTDANDPLNTGMTQT